MSQDSSSRRVDPDKLSWLGKTVYAAGALTHLTGALIDATAHRVATISDRSKKAFEQGRDPNVEEARVLDERATSEDASN